MPSQTRSMLFREVPEEVLRFAEKEHVAEYLPGVLEMTRRVFPDAERGAVVLEGDPEFPDWHIVLEVFVPKMSADDYADRHHQWCHEIGDVCPARYACVFRLGLETSDP
ncbi:MAG TPA: hypothetical protein VIL46_02320 [Gemmataceae bacterium]